MINSSDFANTKAVAVNGDGTAHALNPTCPSKKKCFTTREEAEFFEANNRAKYPNTPKQFVYACEDCPDFHLSSIDPASHSMAASRSPIQHAVPPLRRGRISKAQIEERRAFLENLQIEKPTLSVKESAKLFAARFNVSENAGYQAVYNYNQNVGSRVAAVPNSLDAIANKKKLLEAQLKALEEQEQRLIEAKALKLIPCFDGRGVLIKKEGSQIGLYLEDPRELVEKLVDYLAAL